MKMFEFKKSILVLLAVIAFVLPGQLLFAQPSDIPTIINPFPCDQSNQLPMACRNVCYHFDFQSTGNATSWTETGLPPGLSLNDSGQIRGRVDGNATTGVNNFQVTATIDGQSVTQQFRISVNADPNRCVSCSQENEDLKMLPGQQPCRREISFVIDRSDYMNRSERPGTIGTGNPVILSRWDRLKEVLDGYLALMENSANLDNADRIGVTLFSGGTAPLIHSGIPSAGFPNLSPFTPSGAAPLGGGIQRSVMGFSENLSQSPQEKKRVIILFTSGYQNRNPLILTGKLIMPWTDTQPAAGILAGEFPTSIMNFNNSPFDTIKVYSIGIGTATSSQESLLTDFSAAYQNTTAPQNDLNDLLNSTIPDALNTGSPRILDIRRVKIDSGTTEPAKESFVVNDSVISLSIQVVNLQKPLQDLRSSIFFDGQELNAKPVYNDERSILYDFDFPAIGIGLPNELSSKGIWEIRFSDLTPSEYEVTAIVDETGIHHDIDFNEIDQFLVGEPLPIRVKIWDREGPVTNASVQVTVQSPAEDLGDLLSNTQVSADSLLIDFAGSVPIGQAKLDYLTAQSGFWQQLQPNERQLNLEHSGNGIYTGTLSGNNVTGMYRAIAKISGTHPSLGPYEGRESKFAFFDFGDNATIRANEVVRYRGVNSDNKQLYTVTVTPTNQLGLKIGPAQHDRIAATVSDGSVGKIKDKLDGSYEFEVQVPRDASSELRIFVIDQKNPVVIRRLTGTRFGLSLHIGQLWPLNTTAPFDTLNQGNNIEGDLTLQFSPKSALQLVGGRYQFGDTYDIFGGGIFYERSFVGNRIRSFFPRLAAGAGYFKPDSRDGTLGLGIRAGLANRSLSNLEIGVEGAIYTLPSPGLLFAQAGIELKLLF